MKRTMMYCGEVEQVTDTTVTILFLVEDGEYFEETYAKNLFQDELKEGDEVLCTLNFIKIPKGISLKSLLLASYPKPTPIEGEMEV